MTPGARICPRCSTRVDERRARTSPYCLRCGAPLGSGADFGRASFTGKPPAGGSSALPWILGAVGLFVLMAIGVVVVLLVLVSRARDSGPATVAIGAQPNVEAPTTAARFDAGAPFGTARPTAVPPVHATAPTVTLRPPLTPTTATTPGALGPFPRARAQLELDRAAAGVASCKRATGPFGAGSIRIDFEPDGRVGTLSRPPFAGTPEGACIAARFLSIRLGPFQGGTQEIKKTFVIQR